MKVQWQVSIPADVVSTLLRAGTIDKSDFIGTQTYKLADGSTTPSIRFRLRSLRVGNVVLKNVVAGLASSKGSLLLGQSFLGRFSSWSVDNTKHRLLLTACCQSTAEPALTTQAAVNKPIEVSPRGAVSDSPRIESQLGDLSRQFIFAIYRQMSASNDVAIAALKEAYSDTVNYFGKDMDRDQVVESEVKFLSRWPARTYKPKDGIVFVNCNNTTLTCSASGVLQFDARSTDRNQHSIGEATFTYHLQFSSVDPTHPKVTFENGTVLKRDLQLLYPMADRFGAGQVR